MRTLRIALVACAALLPAAAETLLVLHKRADSLGIYDGATGKSLASVAVGRKPHEIALSPDNRLVYVTDYGCDRWTEDIPGGNTISIVDLAKRAKIGEISLGEYHRPHGIERAASGLFYVTTDFPAALLAVDAVKRRIASVWKVGQSLPHMVAVDHAERTAWVANAGSASATVIDLGSGKMKHIAVGGIPMGVNLSPDERFAYVTTRTADTVAVLDTAKRERVADIRIPGQPVRMRFTPGGETLLVTLIDAGDVAVVDVAARRVVRRFRAGTNCEGVNIDGAGKFAYISAQGDNKVIKYAVDGWQQVKEIATGERPDPILILP